MTPKKPEQVGGKRSPKEGKASEKKIAPSVTPAVADSVAEIQALLASQMRSGKVDVGSDFQMRLARAEDRLVAELKRAGLPAITPRKPLADGTDFTQTDLPYLQGEGNQGHRCVFSPDDKWRKRMAALSSVSPTNGAAPTTA